ncbi:MAG: hypothetical protein AAF654_08795 [Myxococcota bacterium]
MFGAWSKKTQTPAFPAKDPLVSADGREGTHSGRNARDAFTDNEPEETILGDDSCAQPTRATT